MQQTINCLETAKQYLRNNKNHLSIMVESCAMPSTCFLLTMQKSSLDMLWLFSTQFQYCSSRVCFNIQKNPLTICEKGKSWKSFSKEKVAFLHESIADLSNRNSKHKPHHHAHPLKVNHIQKVYGLGFLKQKNSQNNTHRIQFQVEAQKYNVRCHHPPLYVS